MDTAVAGAVAEGKLNPDTGREASQLLHSRIAAHPEWFSSGMKVCRERSLIAADGSESRPDRVVFTPDGVVIIDYKFGTVHPAHVAQVRGYAELYEALGYRLKAGIVWYVFEDKCTFI